MKGRIMRVALAQTSPALAQLSANLASVHEEIQRAAHERADVIVFPELALSGYDLGAAAQATDVSIHDQRLAGLSGSGSDVIVGFHEETAQRCYNSVAYLRSGEVVAKQRKLFLPTYATWEERKHSAPGSRLETFDAGWGRAAILICADAWQPVLPWLAAQAGAEVLFVPANSAVSLEMDVQECWGDLLRTYARLTQSYIVFVNRSGEESGALFWGGSCVIDPSGGILVQAAIGETDLVYADLDLEGLRAFRRRIPLQGEGRLTLINRELTRVMDRSANVD